MNRIRRIRRPAGVLAGLAGAVLAFAAAAPSALASQLRPDPPGWLRRWALPVHLPPGPSGLFKHPPLPPGQVARPVPVYQVPAHTAVIGGMPGWQIALIAAGAALAAATVLVLPDRPGRVPEDTHGGRLSEAPAQVTRAISGPAGQQTPTQRSRQSKPQLISLDSPAYLDRDGRQRYGLPAEVRRQFMESTTDRRTTP